MQFTWRYLAIFLIALVLLGFIVQSARSQALQNCGPYDRLVEALTKKYGEVPIILGTIGTNRTVEFFVSPDHQTFTIIVRELGQDIACILAAGQNWEAIIVLPEPGEPT